MLNVVHGLPGNDFFLSRPKMTPFLSRMRGNRGLFLEKLRKAASWKFSVPGEEIRILGFGHRANVHACGFEIWRLDGLPVFLKNLR